MKNKAFQYVKNNKTILLLAIFLGIITELLFFNNSFLIGKDKIEAQVEKIVGYENENNIYRSTSNDGQFYYNFSSNKIRFVKINLNFKTPESMPIQIYYANDSEFSEDKSIIKRGGTSIDFALPYECNTIRIDFGVTSSDVFSIKEIGFYQDIYNGIAMKIILLSVLIFYLIKIMLFLVHKLSKMTQSQDKIVDFCIIAFAFFLFAYLAWNLPIEYAPDETMRFDIPNYIFRNGSLPTGSEREIINPSWGFSYAFTPYLPALLAIIPMKIAGVFTQDIMMLLRAARFVNVLAGAVTVYFALKIANELFDKKAYKYIFVCFTGFLPQVIFINSYFNNDAFAIMSTSIIIYAWILGEKNNYNWKTCILLAFGIGFCASSYYNAYSFILCSIIIYILLLIKNYKSKEDFKLFIIKGLVVFAIVFAFVGWFFIRNAIIHDGDFLGLNTLSKYAEIYAMDSLKPSNRPTPERLGYTIFDMLFKKFNGMNWIITSSMSFFGVFGSMAVVLNTGFYITYFLVILLGIIGYISSLKKKQRNKLEVFYWFCIIITIGLSISYSYTEGYQPQGRYIMPILIPFMIMIFRGFQFIESLLIRKINMKTKNLVTVILLLIAISLTLIGVGGITQLL